jgi:antiviral helicase SKI2
MRQYTAVEKDLTGKNSTSLLRKPGAKEDFVRGRTGQFPFSPGGLDGVSADVGGEARYKIDEKTHLGPLPSLPPGFTRGLKVKTTNEDIDLEATELQGGDTGEVIRSIHHSNVDKPRRNNEAKGGYEGIDDLLPEEVFSSPTLLTSSFPCWHQEVHCCRRDETEARNGLMSSTSTRK